MTTPASEHEVLGVEVRVVERAGDAGLDVLPRYPSSRSELRVQELQEGEHGRHRGARARWPTAAVARTPRPA